MGYYLLDNPPASSQFYPTRNTTPTFAVGVHTSEGPTGPGSARNLAGFIARRSDPGSYACIVDADETIWMVPPEYTTFSVAASGYNSRAWHICLAGRSDELNPDDSNTQAMITRAGAAIRELWNSQGVALNNNQWIGTDALNRPGLFCHGDVQPWDRSDAWSRHPDRARLDQMLSNAITPTRKGNKMFDFVLSKAERLVLFGIGYGCVAHRWQGAKNGGFGPWAPLHDGQPFPVTNLTANRNADGRFDIMAWDDNGNTCYRTQATAGGAWRPWRTEL